MMKRLMLKKLQTKEKKDNNNPCRRHVGYKLYV